MYDNSQGSDCPTQRCRPTDQPTNLCAHHRARVHCCSAGYFGIAYRQTSWTMAYFATLDEFKKASSTVIPDSWGKAQQLSGGFAAGMFGACFNTPGDVIRSTIQKRALEEWASQAQIVTPCGLLFFRWCQQSRFEMYFAPKHGRCGCKTCPESRKNKPHLWWICSGPECDAQEGSLLHGAYGRRCERILRSRWRDRSIQGPAGKHARLTPDTK